MVLRRRHYLIAAAVPLLLVGAVMAAAWWWWRPPPGLDAWGSGAPPTTWATRARQEELWRREGARRRIEYAYVPLGEVSLEAQLAVLVSEDLDFFGHGAVDLRAIREAIEEWREGGRLRGASTISQQLAKSLYLSGERTLWRKLEEARIAWWMERTLGKRRILELYLNIVEFGPGVYGVEAAAAHYFGTRAREVDAGQGAALAAAIPSPGRDNPSTRSRRWELRQRLIRARIDRVGWLRERLQRLNRQQADAGP
jgi:monofunctional biosynthetic peptidoglycan transglycosylase